MKDFLFENYNLYLFLGKGNYWINIELKFIFQTMHEGNLLMIYVFEVQIFNTENKV